MKNFKELSGPSLEDRDYFRSDYLSDLEKESEAEVPVPDRLLPARVYRGLVRRLKLSQKIGILLWLNSEQLLSIGGEKRLLYLQERASEEALLAGVRFSIRLQKEEKLQSDFKHAARELNRRPQSKRFRVRETRRIGVGYRDKGTLPEISSRARRLTTEESFVYLEDVPVDIQEILQKNPACLTEDGKWVDLSVVAEELRFSVIPESIHSLPNPL